MYILSLIRNLFKWSNIGTIIFFLLNVGVLLAVFGATDIESVIAILILYLISIAIAISPIGEAVLALMSGAKRMSRADMQSRMIPIVTKVHNRALAKSPGLSKVIHLKVMYDPVPNAFALGRRTICITEGLFDLTDDMIEGIIAHEIGHLACHHTVIQLLIGGGNFIITFILMLVKGIAALLTGIGALFSFSRDKTASGCGCIMSIVGLISSGIIWLWTKFCMLFLMWSSRANEYDADKYAMEIGFGYELASALDTIGTGVPQNSLIKALYSSHPETHDRIGKLQALGVPYSRY
ncbi:MAG: M48 family metalloprotease [Clostridia bacterium]|nr:M48 family metalloprotease [Clostridia bacterium]